MEDSGIDSEDKLSVAFDESKKLSNDYGSNSLELKKSHDSYDIAFRKTGLIKSTNSRYISAEKQSSENEHNSISKTQPPNNTCRILQRKLELKVERAKRNYSQYQEVVGKKTQTANLIPISRLSIPGNSEKKPLVDYKSDSSDDPDEISFFSAKPKTHKKLRQPELSDTFSIQEMTIESEQESDDSESQNLELLPPMTKRKLMDYLISCFNCKNVVVLFSDATERFNEWVEKKSYSNLENRKKSTFSKRKKKKIK